jgi:virginiamycin B lyase
VQTIKVGGDPTCIRPGAGALWVGTQTTDDVYRIDPATNAVQTIPVGHGGEICADPNADGVWVANNLADSVSRLDPDTGAVTLTVRVPAKPTDLVRGPDGLEWVASTGAGKVTRIDPKTGDVVGTIDTGGRPFVIRAGFGSVWTGDFGGTTLFRLSP